MANEPNRPIHAILYGDGGGGKSTMAATFPKPMLVFMFDPRGKELPYLRRGESVSADPDEFGTERTLVMSKRDPERMLILIENYHEIEPHRPEAYSRFLKRMSLIAGEYDQWQTIVLDSVTMMELAARKQQQYRLNPTAKDPRQWYAGSTEQLEEMLMMRFGTLPMNVVVVAHVDEEKDEVHGHFIRNPSAPGRMKKRMASAYTDLYRVYAKRAVGGDGEINHFAQTRMDQLWIASCSTYAPETCEPTYQAVWQNGG